MTFKTKGRLVRALAAGIAAAAAAVCIATPAAAFTTGMYDLFNHPDGELTANDPPVHYGLRLDAICNWGLCGSHHTADEKTFSVESSLNVASAWLDWGLGGTDYTKARITGTLYYNDGNSSYDPEWTITYNLQNIQALSGDDPTQTDAKDAVNGWYVDNDDVRGTLVRVQDGLTIYLKGKNDGNGHAFVFDDDGHRCTGHGDLSMCTDDAIVARGWMKAKKEGTSYWKDDGSNDWLVVAKPKDTPPTEVPEPGTLALFGLGLVGIACARRRRALKA
jgi:hypothetical protein